MADDDFSWLIQQLKRGSKDFQTLYNVDFTISDIMLIDRGEIKSWIYMTQKKRIRNKDEEYLKFKVIREYFNNPNITLAQALEIEQREPDYINYNNQVKQENSPYYNEYIFYFYTQQSRNSKTYQVIRPVSRKVAQDLMEKPTEYSEFLSQWQKIIPYKPLNLGGKAPSLYQVEFTQNYETGIQNSIVYRKSIETYPLQKEEFLKSDVPKQPLKFEEKIYKSLSALINEKCNDFMKGVVRFLESQFKELVAVFKLEFFMTNNYKIYISGCPKLQFYDSDGQISTMDKSTMQVAKPSQQIPYKCPGIYCQIEGNNIFYNQNDEAFSLYIPQNADDQNEFKYIQQKSIVLDVIERQKTIEFIKEAISNSNLSLTEQLIFKCKKYYSLSDLVGSKEFKHLKIDNFYKRQRVCNFCFNMYNKLDNVRLQNQGKFKKKIITKQNVNDILIQLKGEKGILTGDQMNDANEKNKFSRKFREKLKEFNIQTKLFNEEFDVQKVEDDNYFHRSFQPENTEIYGSQNYMKQKHGISKKARELAKSQEHFQLPKIKNYSLTDKNKMIFKKQLYVDKNDAEALGLKHYLGHTKNLPKSDCGLAISKSSLALNRLQDKIQEVQNMREKIENDKVKAVREEIEIMLCPYYGNGKCDQTNLKAFVEDLKQRDASEGGGLRRQDSEFQSKRVQVVTDKNEFLSENQKKLKQDKEKKDKEIEDQKKNFLEEHKDLAESIICKRPIYNNNNNKFNNNGKGYKTTKHSKKKIMNEFNIQTFTPSHSSNNNNNTRFKKQSSFSSIEENNSNINNNSNLQQQQQQQVSQQDNDKDTKQQQ